MFSCSFFVRPHGMSAGQKSWRTWLGTGMLLPALLLAEASEAAQYAHVPARFPARYQVRAPSLVTPATSPSACGSSYALRVDVPATIFVKERGPNPYKDIVTNLWGRENVSLGNEDGQPLFRVAYPQGSISPSSGPVKGGAGFMLRLPRAGASACLSYQVRFMPDFAFAYGGKLPGLFGGDAPRGCERTAVTNGFSARLMWRENGKGEIYAYQSPGTLKKSYSGPRAKTGAFIDEECGQSINRGWFTFPTGQWITVTEEVISNTIGAEDGSATLWIDGNKQYTASDLYLRRTANVGVDGLLFSTFFGGSTEGWASPRDQYADFRNISIWYTSRP